MTRNAELILSKNMYCLAAIVVLASSLVGSASGTTHKSSCLSYGHSCWGAHGKRSGGNIIAALRPIETANVGGSVQEIRQRLPPLDERWLLSRLVNRQLMQVPLAAAARMRVAGRILDEDRPMMDFDKNVELNDLAKSDQKSMDEEPDNLLMPEQRELIGNDNDRAIKAGLYKILRNIN